MILRRLALFVASLLLLGTFATPAHAGWYRTRAKQQAAKQALQKKQTDELNNKINAKNQEDANRWVKKQRFGTLGARTYSSQSSSSNYRPTRVEARHVQTLAAIFGGSRRYVEHSSATHEALIRNMRGSGSGPVYGFKVVTEHRVASSSTGPTLFAFNQY